MELSGNKEFSIETLRGMGIMLVVAGHVIGSGSSGGMQVANHSFLRHFYHSIIEFIQMPLFAAISGWVYAIQTDRKVSLSNFIGKKAQRLLIPLIFTGGSYFLFQYFIPGTNHKGELSEIWKIVVFPYSLYWFLPSLFIVFFVVAMIETQHSRILYFTAKTLRSKVLLLICFLSLSIIMLQLRDLFIPETSPNFFSYKGAIYLLPFFITGIMIKRFESFFSKKKGTIIFLMILFAGMGYQQLAWYQVIPGTFDRQGGVGLLIGISAIILLFKMHWESKWLAWIGGYSYTIFLFHGFGTAGGRILLKSGGICNPFVIFTVSLAAGLLFPLIAWFFLDRTSLTRWLFLGKPYLKRS